MDLQLASQLVIVTGGSSGIGLATARLFLQEGAHVALWDIAAPSSEATAVLNETVNKVAGRWIFCQVDVTQQASLEAAWEQSQRRFGKLEHVVHAAAIGSGKFGFPFTNLTPEDWPGVLDVNIMGMVRVAHCLAPVLRAQAGGTLTFLASVAGQMGSQTDPPYSASKAANINFAQCLAKDLAAHGVRVNVVNPGMVQTPLNESVWRAWLANQPADEHTTYAAWAEAKIRQVVPLQRWQTPEDIANAIVFLASPRAANITGQCLNVDGGFVMHS